MQRPSRTISGIANRAAAAWLAPPQQDAAGPGVREHEALMPHDVQNERNGHGGRCSDASAQRQRSWRTIKNAGLAAAERDQILRHNGPAGKESESGTHRVWKGP